MKQRVLGWVAFGFFALGGTAVLAGCPIYPDNGDYRVCTGSACYDCPTNNYSDSCVAWQCNQDYDCPNGYSCQNDRCVSGTSTSTNSTCAAPTDCASGSNCGTDDICHPGDCSSSGCPTGYVCKLTDGAVSCVSSTTTTGDSGKTFSGCTSDAACASLGSGEKCLDGSCVAPADQCSDATQCPNSEQCVAGVCTPSCSGSVACPTGYACDSGTGVCSQNPTPCGDTQTCSSGLTCVDQHCVTPCGAGNTCATGLVCVDNGCIPDQRPQFVCNVNGQAGDGTANSCATGSICLHHNCYISCNGEAGTCNAADRFNVCKDVSTSGGSYPVCGSSSNLGNECDPTQQLGCTASQVCIDGYCR